jgi:hypothetical protein
VKELRGRSASSAMFALRVKPGSTSKLGMSTYLGNLFRLFINRQMASSFIPPAFTTLSCPVQVLEGQRALVL